MSRNRRQFAAFEPIKVGSLVIPRYQKMTFYEDRPRGEVVLDGGSRLKIVTMQDPMGLPEPEDGVIFVVPKEVFLAAGERRDLAMIHENCVYRRGTWATGRAARIWNPMRRER